MSFFLLLVVLLAQIRQHAAFVTKVIIFCRNGSSRRTCFASRKHWPCTGCRNRLSAEVAKPVRDKPTTNGFATCARSVLLSLWRQSSNTRSASTRSRPGFSVQTGGRYFATKPDMRQWQASGFSAQVCGLFDLFGWFFFGKRFLVELQELRQDKARRTESKTSLEPWIQNFCCKLNMVAIGQYDLWNTNT